MKLYKLYITNNLHYSDWDYQERLIVANSDKEADIRAKAWMEERYRGVSYEKPSYEFEEITSVDGFKITVSR